LQIGADAPIGTVASQVRRRVGRSLVDLDALRSIRHRPPQLRIGEDEVDDLVLGAECGRPVLLGQFVVELD